MFDFAEEALDRVALAIKARVDRALNATVPLGRDVRLAAMLATMAWEPRWAMRARAGGSPSSRAATAVLSDVAGGEHDPQWKAILVHDGIDLGAQSSTRTANGVIRAPFHRLHAGERE